MCTINSGSRDAIVAAMKVGYPTVKHQHRHDHSICAIGMMVPGSNAVSFEFSGLVNDDALTAPTNPTKFGEKKIALGNYFVPINARLEFAVVDLTDPTPWQSAVWTDQFDTAGLTAAGVTASAISEVEAFANHATFWSTDQDGNAIICDLDLSSGESVPTNKHPLLTGGYNNPALLIAPAVLTNPTAPDPAADPAGEVYAWRICFDGLGIKGLCNPLTLKLAERCVQNAVCPPCGTTTVDTSASASTNFNIAKYGVIFE